MMAFLIVLAAARIGSSRGRLCCRRRRPHGGGGLGYVFQLFCSSLPELRHGLGQATTVVVPVSVKQERERELN